MPNDITIHQTIHGYRGGHSLIAGSLSLAPDVSNLLLSMSDLSGPSVVPGFQEYLTAYPVGDALYAIAKTWYASEMPRPGSVWTHSLLIPRTEIDKVEKIGGIVAAFRRPQTTDVIVLNDLYSSPLHVWNETNPDFRMLGMGDNEIDHLVDAIYSFPNRPIVAAASMNVKLQTALLRVWEQQWPKLRHAFSFCTGAISSRKLRGRPLDVQIVPISRVSQFRRELSDAIWVEDLLSDTPRKDWVTIASRDITSGDAQNVKEFLWYAGSDVNNGRTAYSYLIRLFSSIDGLNEDVEQLVKNAAQLFPEPDEALNVKQLFLGQPSHWSPRKPLLIEAVKILLRLEDTRPFERLTSSVSDFAMQLFRDDRETALKLAHIALTESGNIMGGHFISGMAAALPPSEIVLLEQQEPLLVNALVRRDPRVATNPMIWRITQRPIELLDIVAQCQIDDGTKTDISKAIIESDSDSIVIEAAKRLGRPFVFQIMDSIKTGEVGSASWRQVGSMFPEFVLEWLRYQPFVPPNDSFWAAHALDPNNDAVVESGSRIWLDNAYAALIRSDQEALHYCCFCLTLAFHNPDEIAPELASQTFQKVHDAAAAQDIRYESWRLLDRVTPPVTWWREWDRCERLRAALVDCSEANNWSTGHFLRAINSPDTFARTIELNKTSKVRATFVSRVVNDILTGSVKADPVFVAVADAARRGRRVK